MDSLLAASSSSDELRARYERDGAVVVRGVVPPDECRALAELLDGIVRGAREPGIDPRQQQIRRDRGGAPTFVKISELARSHPRFRALAHAPETARIVEALIGPGARFFRDVAIGKPARRGHELSAHQDSAYWDVDPPSLVSAWIALTDAPVDRSCLEIVPGSHRAAREHTLVVGGRELPRPVVRTLRRLVSVAGTGDNPSGTKGSMLAWRAKAAAFSLAPRVLPALSSLSDYRIAPSEHAAMRFEKVPIAAGDAVFFHSLLVHATGANASAHDRWAFIASYMPARARYRGRSIASFPLVSSR